MKQWTTTEDFIANGKIPSSAQEGFIVQTEGYSSKGDGGGAQWKFTGVTGQTASQSPAQLVDAKITDSNGAQYEQTGRVFNLRTLGMSEGATGANNDLSIAAGVAAAAKVVRTILANKIDLVYGSIFVPTGQFDYTEITLPDGVMLTGDGSANSILVDKGTDTSRASVEVGSQARDSHRSGLKEVALIGAGLTNRNGVNLNKCYRLSGIFESSIDGFYDNVTGNTFAVSFIHNRIYSAVRDNFNLFNATATRFQDNRIELAGRHNVTISGEGQDEPINVSFNSDRIQSAKGSAINGIDVLGIEINDCFFEANNQDGGFTCINLVGGAQARENGTFKMSGGFMSPGSGQGGTAIQIGNIKTAVLNPIFIRGNGWLEGVRFGSSVENITITGEVSTGGSNVILPNSEGLKLIRSLRGEDSVLRGYYQQNKLDRVRTTSVNTSSEAIDATVFISTVGGNRIYTIRTADTVAGRKIKLQKTTGDSNRMVVRTEGSQLINGDALEFFVDGAFAHLELSCDGTNWFAG